MCWRKWRAKGVLGYARKAQSCCILSVSEDSKSKFCNRNSSCTICLNVVNRFCWKKWRAKGVLGYATKGVKLLLFVEVRRFDVQILHSKFFTRNLFKCREKNQEMACKRRSWVRKKRHKIVAFWGFEKIQRPKSPIKVLHEQFIWVSWTDSVERNGVQKAFLDNTKCDPSNNLQTTSHLWVRMHRQPCFQNIWKKELRKLVRKCFKDEVYFSSHFPYCKIVKMKVSCHKDSRKRLRLRIQCYMLSRKQLFWTSIVFALIWTSDFLWISNYTILCSWRRIYSHTVSNPFQEPKSQIRSLWWQSSWIEIEISTYTIQCVLSNPFLTTTKNLSDTRRTGYCLTRDGHRRLWPLPTCINYIGNSMQISMIWTHFM